MKKKIIIGLACLMAGAGLAGCGAGGNTGGTAETTTTAEVTTTAETTTTSAETTTATTEATTTTTTEAPTTTTTETPTTIANAHPEDEQIMENLRKFYKSHEIVDGVPVYDGTKYLKFVIADFDADGESEAMIEIDFEYIGGRAQQLHMYNKESSLEGEADVVLPLQTFDEITFLDNGVAYAYSPALYKAIDERAYYLISEEMPAKLNYNMALANFESNARILHYESDSGTIKKYLGSFQDVLFDPKEKTQAEYEAEKAILNSGRVMDFEVKDFTAENIGL